MTTITRRSIRAASDHAPHDAWSLLARPLARWAGWTALGVIAVVGFVGSPPGRAVVDLPSATDAVYIQTPSGRTAVTSLKPGWWPRLDEEAFFEPLPATHLATLPRVTTPSRVLLDVGSPDQPMVVAVVERYRDRESGETLSPATIRVGDRVDVTFEVRNLQNETLRDVRLEDPVLGDVALGRPLEPFRAERVTVEDVVVPARIGVEDVPRLLLGTDPNGRDVAARLARGTWRSVRVAGGAALLSFVLGGAAGWLAARKSRAVVTALGRARLVLVTFPFLLVALVVVLLMGSSAPVLILLIGTVSVPITGRRVRDEIVLLERSVPAETALASGRPWQDVERHLVVPSVVRSAAGTAFAVAAAAILVETSLAFLGLGPSPPGVSLGTMVADVQPVVDSSPGYLLLPGSLIVLAMAGCIALAESLSRTSRFEGQP